MKFTIRVIALASVVAAAAAGNSLPKNNTLFAIHRSSVPGPVPTCNPLTEACSNIRGK